MSILSEYLEIDQKFLDVCEANTTHVHRTVIITNRISKFIEKNNGVNVDDLEELFEVIKLLMNDAADFVETQRSVLIWFQSVIDRLPEDQI